MDNFNKFFDICCDVKKQKNTIKIDIKNCFFRINKFRDSIANDDIQSWLITKILFLCEIKNLYLIHFKPSNLWVENKYFIFSKDNIKHSSIMTNNI